MSDRRRLTSFITTRPVAILMVFVAAVVFGWLSIGRQVAAQREVNVGSRLDFQPVVVSTSLRQVSLGRRYNVRALDSRLRRKGPWQVVSFRAARPHRDQQQATAGLELRYRGIRYGVY